MNFTKATANNVEKLLGDFESTVTDTISLIYENKHEEVSNVNSRLLLMANMLTGKMPELKDLDWFKAIVKESIIFQEKQTESPGQRASLLNVLFENQKHLVRFRHDEYRNIKNHRVIKDDLFATAIKTSGIEYEFEQLALTLEKLTPSLNQTEPELSRVLERINTIVNQCEFHSYLSIMIAWEILCGLIYELREHTDRSKTVFRDKLPGLEQDILQIEYCIEEFHELVNIAVRITYDLKKSNFNYQKRFLADSIFI
ncbi:hypothetical protein [Aliikangiella coralliicola]|uniref:Uncharacterized protein n=1 Tax=Aliikangiella coralliicola TaxID=2592383 RepID=A0A545U6G4_9GAMM|nr:hypothetical protein [Aliikangiella coralliicola]TQV85024.1 hypothetical protein FLL46_21785 [Aliikangiella coralliicola]